MRYPAFLVVDLLRAHLLSCSTVLQSIVFQQHTGHYQKTRSVSLSQVPVSSLSLKVTVRLTSTSPVAMTQLSKIMSMTLVVFASNRVLSLDLDREVDRTDNELRRRGWCVLHHLRPSCSHLAPCAIWLCSAPAWPPTPKEEGPGHLLRSLCGICLPCHLATCISLCHPTPLLFLVVRLGIIVF